MGLLEEKDLCPPLAVRLLSRKTPNQIADSSGLSRSTVLRMSQLMSWRSVKIGVAESYCYACGYSFAKLPVARWQKVQESGLSRLPQLSASPKHKPWQIGSISNRRKSVARAILKEDQ